MRDKLLTISKDPSIKAIYKTRENVNAKLERVWKATSPEAIANAEVELNLQLPAELSNQGIWHRNFHPNPSLSEKHNLVSAKAYILHKEQLKAHALSLKHQYIWLQ